MLSVEEGWILEEMIDPIDQLSSSPIDASESLWLIQSSGPDQDLAVYKPEDLPNFAEETAKGVFRLSRRKEEGMVDKKSKVAKNNDNTSPDVGTKLLWEDANVKIWEFRLEPQETCNFHRHFLPYFFLNLSESLTQELNATAKPVDRPPNLQTKGQCTYVSRENLGSHGVQNVGGDTFLQFIVEFV